MNEEEFQRELQRIKEQAEEVGSEKVDINLTPTEQAKVERDERRRGFEDGKEGLSPKYPNTSYWEGYEMGLQVWFDVR